MPALDWTQALEEIRAVYKEGVADRLSHLFNCLTSLAAVRPVYQFSLKFFLGTFQVTAEYCNTDIATFAKRGRCMRRRAGGVPHRRVRQPGGGRAGGHHPSGAHPGHHAQVHPGPVRQHLPRAARQGQTHLRRLALPRPHEGADYCSVSCSVYVYVIYEDKRTFAVLLYLTLVGRLCPSCSVQHTLKMPL
eukprot:9476350-Pyramimonas_sp.AAC.1